MSRIKGRETNDGDDFSMRYPHLSIVSLLAIAALPAQSAKSNYEATEEWKKFRVAKVQRGLHFSSRSFLRLIGDALQVNHIWDKARRRLDVQDLKILYRKLGELDTDYLAAKDNSG